MHFPSIIAEKFGTEFKSLSNFWKASGEEAIYCTAAATLLFVAGGLCSGQAGAAGSQHPQEQITHRWGNRTPTFALLKALKPERCVRTARTGLPTLTDTSCLRGENGLIK